MDFLRGIDTSSGGGNNLIMGGGYEDGRWEITGNGEKGKYERLTKKWYEPLFCFNKCFNI